METCSFYEDRRFCVSCRDYVRYLRSPQATYCVQCGTVVRLFSEDDWGAFQRSLRQTPTVMPAHEGPDNFGAA